MSADETLRRAEELLARLEEKRVELERLSEEADDEKALAILADLSELSKDVEAELARARQQAEARADG